MSVLKSQVEVGDYPPTDQVKQLIQQVFVKIDELLSKLSDIKKKEVSVFNQLAAKSQLPAPRVNSKLKITQ